MFGGLVHDPSFFDELISEEMMQESPYYEHIIKRGIEQGARENSINNILSVLTKRFPLSDVQPVSEALESIEDLDRLTELHLTAIDISGVEAFLQRLDA